MRSLYGAPIGHMRSPYGAPIGRMRYRRGRYKVADFIEERINAMLARARAATAAAEGRPVEDVPPTPRIHVRLMASITKAFHVKESMRARYVMRTSCFRLFIVQTSSRPQCTRARVDPNFPCAALPVRQLLTPVCGAGTRGTPRTSSCAPRRS